MKKAIYLPLLLVLSTSALYSSVTGTGYIYLEGSGSHDFNDQSGFYSDYEYSDVFYYSADRNALRIGNTWDSPDLMLDPYSIGRFSLGIGDVGNEASGDYSFAMGQDAVAYSSNAFAFGNDVIASGSSSVAWGSGAEASGTRSWSFGVNTESTGSYSYSYGAFSTSSGMYSLSYGYQASASATSAIALGSYSRATGSYSVGIVGGLALFPNSIALGSGTQTYTDSQVVVGVNSAVSGTSPGGAAAVFVVGNGDLEYGVGSPPPMTPIESNAFEVYRDGSARIFGDLTVDGSLLANLPPVTFEATDGYLGGSLSLDPPTGQTTIFTITSELDDLDQILTFSADGTEIASINEHGAASFQSLSVSGTATFINATAQNTLFVAPSVAAGSGTRIYDHKINVGAYSSNVGGQIRFEGIDSNQQSFVLDVYHQLGQNVLRLRREGQPGAHQAVADFGADGSTEFHGRVVISEADISRVEPKGGISMGAFTVE